VTGPTAALAALLAAAAAALLVRPDPAARLARGRLPSWLRLRRNGSGPGLPGPGPAPVPVVTDLVAAALLTGLPPAAAVEAVASALENVGDPAAESLRRNDSGFTPLTEALALAPASGLGPVPLVQAAAARSRRRRAAAQQVAARRVGTLVVLPTGVCLLPAFVLLTVAPLVVDLVSR
jgi:hypothetical protein